MIKIKVRKLKLFLAFTFLSSNCFAANTSPSYLLLSSFHVSPKETIDSNNKTQCTLQLIRSEGQCYLLGAFHCLGSGRSRTYAEVAPSQFLELQVSKTSSALDLVLYNAPNALPNYDSVCRTLNEITPYSLNDLKNRMGPSDSAHLQAVGVIGSKLWTEFSFSENWYQASTSSQMTLLDMGNAQWIHLKNIQIFPGMSGGVVSTRDQRAVGMITGYIYLQDLALVIPYESILSFVKSKNAGSSGLNASPVKLGSVQGAAENLFSGGGENEHGKGGENEHGKGGENEHGKGGNGPKINFRILPEYVLHRAQEPDEGIAYPDDQSLRLLSVGGMQVDGKDDYLKLRRDPMYAKYEKVFRKNNSNSLVDLKLREKIMERFNEVYHSLYRPQGVEHLIYRIDPRHPMGWSLAYFLSLPFDINIEKKNIYLSSAAHGTFQRGRALEGFLNGDLIAGSQMKDDFSFSIKATKDYEQIILRGKHRSYRSWSGAKVTELEFVCNNNNYLKLVCRSSQGLGANLSFSRSNQVRGELKFRITFFEEIDKQFYLHHYYGVLDTSSDVKRMRERFFDFLPSFEE